VVAAMNDWEAVPQFDDVAEWDPGPIPAAYDFPERTTPTAPAMRLLDDVQLMALPDPDWLVADILPRKGVAVLVGPPGSFKTTLVAGLLLDIATGRAWFGHAVRHPGPSIYVGAEDPSGFKMRLAASKRARALSLEIAVGVHTYPDAIDLRDSANVGRFISFVKAQARGGFETVVVDTYAAATPGAAENSSEDTTAAMAAAFAIRDALKATVVLVHHTNAAGTRERGHSAMKGSADAMTILEPVDDVIHVRCDKMRNGPFFDTLTLKAVPVDGGGLVLRLARDVLQSLSLTALQTQVLDALRDVAGIDGASKTTWRAACGTVTERSFYKVASTLEERGHVVKIGAHFRPKVKR
jgi:hypothetical protein